jgi:hypothetical protein
MTEPTPNPIEEIASSIKMPTDTKDIDNGGSSVALTKEERLFAASLDQHIQDQTLRNHMVYLFRLYTWMNQNCPGSLIMDCETYLKYNTLEKQFNIETHAQTLKWDDKLAEFVKHKIISDYTEHMNKKRKLSKTDE